MAEAGRRVMKQLEKPRGQGWYWRRIEGGVEIVLAEQGCKGLLLYRHGDEEPYLLDELSGPYMGPLEKPVWEDAN